MMAMHVNFRKMYIEYTKSWLRCFNSSSAEQRLFIEKKDVTPKTLIKAYKPKEFESSWYNWWESNNYFQPVISRPPFTMLLPPPNVTGTLHLGHALTGTIEDVIARWRRMSGDSVMWIPGVDHAGIATQVVVEKLIKSEMNKTKHALGREEFVNRIWDWKHIKEKQIGHELRSLGLSLDWTKHIFTMDALPSEAVVKAFVDLFEKGLIYRKNSLVNWSCALQSSISDVEVEWREIKGPLQLRLPGTAEPIPFGSLYKIAYPVENTDLEIIVATTRPETMLGDAAVALHPDDSRRSSLEGKSVFNPFRNCAIPIIFDPFVDRSFGTGAVKVTPAHNLVDWEVAQRHNLESVAIFDDSGHLITPMFKGKHRFEARKLVIDFLNNVGSFRGSTDHPMNIPMCSRSGDIVELMLRPQWFLNCQSAAQEAIRAVRNGQLTFCPENYEKVWFHWLENIRDWNISRQLWWGHRVPAYQVTRLSNGEQIWVAAGSINEAQQKAQRQMNAEADDLNIVADPDVLDTWFSSGLFPLYSLGWPKSNEEFKKRFPLPIMETGNDIIFYWVARMVMMSLMLTGEIPFKKIVLHGLLCDARGRKMSKSLGNVISPDQIISGATPEQLENSVKDAWKRGILTDEEMTTSLEGQRKLYPDGIPECGTDALRFTLCSQSIQSGNISFDVNVCHTNKLFCNKVYQAFKFLLMSVENECGGEWSWSCSLQTHVNCMTSYDKWIISRLAAAVSHVTNGLQAFQFHLVTLSLKQFIYSQLCDVYLEALKPVLRSDNELARRAGLSTLFNCLEVSFRLLHPFMPFLTEELYQRLPSVPGFTPSESIMIADFPLPDTWSSWRDPQLDSVVVDVQDIVTSVRKLKALFGTKGQKPEVIVATSSDELKSFIKRNISATTFLARASKITVQDHVDEMSEDMSAYLKEKVKDNTVVYAKVQSGPKICMEKIEPTLRREGKIVSEMAELEELMAGGRGKGRGRDTPESRARNLNKMKQLQLELEKILQIKQMLQQKR